MTSLSAMLERLAKESDQISEAAWINDVPSGPFTQGYLSPQVTTLVRDADVSEKRPFRRLLDDEYAALHAAGPSKPKPSASSMPSKPQAATAPRANPNPDFLLTPLRKLPQVRGTPAEVDATLSALENVIESLNTNFSLKRARTESRTLRDRHAAASARFAELERLIAAAKVRSEAPPEPAPAPAPQEAEEEKPPMSVDEAIAAEEEALRALEAALAPARRERVLKPTTPRPPRASASPKASPKNPSPRVRNSLATKQQTPTKPLSIGVTPQRPALTPRAPNVAANQNQNQNQPRQSIFGPPRANATPARLGPLALFGGATPRARTAATPRRAPLASIASPEPATPAPAAALPAATPAAPTPAPAPVPPTPAAEPEPQTRTVAGVEVDHPAMLGVIDHMWERLEQFMRTGAASPVGRTPEATVTHLVALSDATVDPAATPTVTPDAVLFAHSVLVLLRSVRTDRSAEDTYVVLPDLKNELVEVATRRGWDAPDELAAKVSYQPVGHKIVHIDRRARGGARLRLVGL